MAIASVSCASGESEPSDMAPVTKCFTISASGSTSSSGIGVAAEVEQVAEGATGACAVGVGGEVLERLEAAGAYARVAASRSSDGFHA